MIEVGIFICFVIICDKFFDSLKKDKTRFKSEVDESDYYKQVKEIDIGTVDKNGKMWTGSRWL